LTWPSVPSKSQTPISLAFLLWLFRRTSDKRYHYAETPDSDQQFLDPLPRCKDNMMARKSSRAARPSQIVMDELAGEQVPWDLEKHLHGCLVGYQTAPSYGTAVFFALEALWGIARDAEVRANSGGLDPDQLDNDWILSPKTNLEVPWIWIQSLATAWEKYKAEDAPLGQAFGLEGGGQGKPPTILHRCKYLMSGASPVGSGSAFKSSEVRDKKFESRTWFKRQQRSLKRATKRSDGHGNASGDLNGCDL
jgi:hypothetical protein